MFLQLIVFTQNIRLDSCLHLAEKAYPLKSKETLLRQSLELNNKLSSSTYLPSLSIKGQLSWQTDVSMLEIDNDLISSMFPEISKDQYRIYADFYQTIWDGGASTNNKKLQEAKLKADIQELNVNIYRYKEQLIEVYFVALELQKQKEVLFVKENQLDNVISDTRVAKQNNIAMQADIDVLQAEKLLLKQRITELEYEIKSLIAMFSEYCNREFDENSIFLTPTPELNTNMAMKRPELNLFDYRAKQIMAGQKILKSSRYPKFFAFAQTGYGRPGLNMLSNDFKPFAIVGAKFVWNPFDWNKTKHKEQLLEIKAGIVENKQQTFVLHQNAKIKSQLEKIKKIEEVSKQDAKILSLRENVSKTLHVKLNNGVIKSSDYLNALNQEYEQRLRMELHQLILYKEIVKYNMLKGNLYE